MQVRLGHYRVFVLRLSAWRKLDVLGGKSFWLIEIFVPIYRSPIWFKRFESGAINIATTNWVKTHAKRYYS